MSKEKDAFLEDLAKEIGFDPSTISDKQLETSEIASRYYRSMQGGDIVNNVTRTIARYVHEVLPELSLTQAIELTAFMHSIIETVFIYLVDDGLIKED